jgi:hypothetical protein
MEESLLWSKSPPPTLKFNTEIPTSKVTVMNEINVLIREASESSLEQPGSAGCEVEMEPHQSPMSPRLDFGLPAENPEK